MHSKSQSTIRNAGNIVEHRIVSVNDSMQNQHQKPEYVSEIPCNSEITPSGPPVSPPEAPPESPPAFPPEVPPVPLQDSPPTTPPAAPLPETAAEASRVRNPRGTIQFLTIIGQIEGHMILPPNNKATKYEHVIPQLVMCAENPEVDGLMVLLNTVGGDVEAGLAIAELISNLGKPVVSLVLGGGHSIGVPLAVSAQYAFIAPSATMTIHPVRVNGTVVGAQQTYDYFNKMQDRVLDFIVAHSKITRDRLTGLMLDTRKLIMDVGTILIGEEAVNEKIIDAVGGLYDAMEKLYTLIAEKKAARDTPAENTLSADRC